MPLILITGYPSSGKTHRTSQLLSYLSTRIATSTSPHTAHLTLHTISDQTLSLPRSVYREARTEKDARAAAYSAVKRVLGRDAIVIADGLNYIKGFRYQLYCEAKAVQTPSCVVHVGTPVERCREINERLLGEGEGYARDVFDNLIFRYEEPNGMSRWDSPLFTVPFEDETPDLEGIWDAMVGGKAKAVKANLATRMAPATGTDYLYELDKSSQEIVTSILDWQKDHVGEGGAELDLADGMISLPASPVSLPQLQRIRRQFISMNRLHNLPKSRIRALFVEYLNDNLR